LNPEITPSTSGLQSHRVSFSGSGSDYFRLWLSNLLLTIVTLGIYTPWARRRRIQYFYRNTLVGADPLDFVASSRNMATGFLLVVAVYALINALSSAGLNAAVGIITLSIAALVPWLWRSAQRFRLGNTTWRGLRFQFQATTREAYTAAWPLLAAAFVVAVLSLLSPAVGALSDTRVPPVAALLVALAVMIGIGVVLIGLRFNFLQLQMTRTSLGGQRGRFKASFGSFFKVALICLGVALLTYGVLIAVLAGVAASQVGLGRTADGPRIVMLAGLAIVTVPLMLVPALITLAAWQALVFRTIWSHAGLSDLARSKCNLKTSSFVILRTKNILLTLLTLGLYRPFAAVSEYRMKVESVRIYTRGNLDTLAGKLAQQQSALGDAAADMVGFDIV
jgi:uncharacterized membrane protein YjgN (DUF898 family)